MPEGERITFFDKPRPKRRERYGRVLDHIGFVRARPKKKCLIAEPAAKDIPARGITAPPGVLVPDFYLDPQTKILGCYAAPWEDILVDELEEKMRPKVWEKYIKDAVYDFRKEYLGAFAQYAPEDITATGRIIGRYKRRYRASDFEHIDKKPLRGIKADEIFFDGIRRPNLPRKTMLGIDYAAIEMRVHAQLTQVIHDDVDCIVIDSLSTFNPSTPARPTETCRPTAAEPPHPPAIFRPSPPTYNASAAKVSVIPRLLASSVSRRPLSTSG